MLLEVLGGAWAWLWGAGGTDWVGGCGRDGADPELEIGMELDWRALADAEEEDDEDEDEAEDAEGGVCGVLEEEPEPEEE